MSTITTLKNVPSNIEDIIVGDVPTLVTYNDSGDTFITIPNDCISYVQELLEDIEQYKVI